VNAAFPLAAMRRSFLVSDITASERLIRLLVDSSPTAAGRAGIHGRRY
jgi:hypothetical protein